MSCYCFVKGHDASNRDLLEPAVLEKPVPGGIRTVYLTEGFVEWGGYEHAKGATWQLNKKRRAC
jgi:hypothetical protein